MKEILEWDAVLADGTHIPITVAKIERATGSVASDRYVGNVDGWPKGRAETPVLAAHETVTLLLREGKDVRDLVPRGNPSRAELEAQLAALRSDSDDFRVTTQALINALPRCNATSGEAECNAPAMKSGGIGYKGWCDVHVPKGLADYPYAATLRVILAMLAQRKP